MKRPHLLIPLLAAVFALMPACGTMAPKYARPDAPVPGEWPAGAAYQKTEGNASAAKPADLEWRSFITDEKLRQVIETALANNRDMRIAALNVEKARTQYGLQRSALLPLVNAVASENRQSAMGVAGYAVVNRSSQVVPVVKRSITEVDSVSLGMASWEIDFFGRIQSLKDAALQQYLATEQARRSAQIMLISSVATAYHALAADQESLTLANTTLETQQGIYQLVKRRFEGGVATDLDVQRAQTQVDSARGDAARYTQVAALDKNALDFLVGAPVADTLLPGNLGAITPPVDIAAGTPSEVLLNRPDVLASESVLKAANANIGAARAAFFPRISLTAAVATASNVQTGLFDPGTGVWTYAPQVALPVFDPRTWHAARLSKEEKKIAVAEYERAIQSAFKEVADALAVHGTVDQQLAAQESLVGAVERAYKLSDLRYTKGMDSYLSVLDAQRSVYAAQQGLVALRLAKLANQIRLYAVLGGGWSASETTAKS